MNISKRTRFVASMVAVIALLVAVVFANTNNSAKSSNADSAKQESYEKYLPTIEKIAKECGLYVAKQQCPDVDFSVKSTNPIYNVTEDIVGYSVALESNGVNYGYVNCDFTTEQLVTDFAVSKDANSLHEELTEDFVKENDSVDAKDCTDKLYNVNGVDYAVSADDNEDEYFFYAAETYTSPNFEEILDYYEENYIEYYDNTEYEDCFFYGIPEDSEDFVVEGKIADWFKKWIKKFFPSFFNEENDEIVPTAYPEHSEVLKTVDKCLGTMKEPVMLPQYDPAKSMISQKTIMTTTKKYACGLVALTAICQQEDLLTNGNIQDTFNALWNITGTDKGIYDVISNYGIDGIECSGTSTYMMAQGMTEYGKTVGADIKYGFKQEPQVDFFQQAVNANMPSVLCYQIKDKGGHGISIFGYTTSTVGNQTFDYIVAADGWYDDAPRYVMYYPSLFESASGIAYQIKK